MTRESVHLGVSRLLETGSRESVLASFEQGLVSLERLVNLHGYEPLYNTLEIQTEQVSVDDRTLTEITAGLYTYTNIRLSVEATKVSETDTHEE